MIGVTWPNTDTSHRKPAIDPAATVQVPSLGASRSDASEAVTAAGGIHATRSSRPWRSRPSRAQHDPLFNGPVDLVLGGCSFQRPRATPARASAVTPSATPVRAMRFMPTILFPEVLVYQGRMPLRRRDVWPDDSTSIGIGFMRRASRHSPDSPKAQGGVRCVRRGRRRDRRTGRALGAVLHRQARVGPRAAASTTTGTELEVARGWAAPQCFPLERQVPGMRLPVTSSIEIRTQCCVDRVAHECSGPRRSPSSSSSSVISRAVPLTRTLQPA
jgi:hypothetical protein